MKISLLCSTYDDPLGVERLLESDTIDKFDSILILDGKYFNFNHKLDYDENLTSYIIKDSKLKNIIYKKTEPMFQSNKRNMMFAYTMHNDYTLVCDSDEIPYFNRELFETENVESCSCIMLDNYGLLQPRPRLFNMKHLPYFKTNHSEIFSSITGKDIAQEAIDNKTMIESIIIKHDKSLRSKQRKIDRRGFVNPNLT